MVFRRWRPHLTVLIDRFEPSLRQRIVSGAVWSIVGAGLASGLTMVSNVVCARFLGATRFGELAIVLATTNLFTTLLASGLGMTATRFVAEHRNSDPQRAGTVVGLSWVTSIVVGAATALLVVLFAPWLSRGILGAAGLAGAVSLGAVVMFFAALNGSQVGALSGLEAFNWVALGNLVRGIAIVVFVTAGAAWDGVSGALLGYIAVGAATAVFYQFAIRRKCVRRRSPFRIVSPGKTCACFRNSRFRCWRPRSPSLQQLGGVTSCLPTTAGFPKRACSARWSTGKCLFCSLLTRSAISGCPCCPISARNGIRQGTEVPCH